MGADRARDQLGRWTSEGAETPYPATPKMSQEHIAAAKRFSDQEGNNHLRMVDKGASFDRFKTFASVSDEEKSHAEAYDEAVKHVAALNDAIEKHGVDVDGPVYRGLRGVNDKRFNDLITSDKIGLQALSSASTSGKVAMGYASEEASPGRRGIVLEIRGANGLPIRDVSKYHDEHEITLNKHHQYRVVGHGPTEHPNVTRVVVERIK
jgi:NAD:arginine ADP-ribosyltransferase